MTPLFFLLILLVASLGVALLFLKGKPEKKVPQEANPNDSEKTRPIEPPVSQEFSQTKEVFSQALKSTLKSRFQIIPLLNMPPAPEDFLGRINILADVFGRINNGPTLIGLYGISGVGKTALGLILAQKLLADFPDPPMYLDIRGSSEKPLSPEEAMIRIIHSMAPGIPYPETESKRTQLYRTLLKRRKSVLFLDNVPGGLNLKDFLPPKNCALIVASVKPLNAPQFISKKLNPLDSKDAQALLVKTSPRTGFWINEIAKMCNDFPLALVLSAKFIGANPQQDAAGFVENLSEELKRLKAEARADVKPCLDLVLTLSYRSLSEKASAVLRKLTLFPDTFDDKAEAFLCEDPDSEHLVRLLTLGLVISNPETNRFHLHHQVRRFLTHRLKESEKELADKRFATFYLTVLINAGKLYAHGGEDREKGLNQFELEWDNIEKGQDWAHSKSDHDEEADNLCLSYTEAGIQLLRLGKSPAVQIKWLQAALNSSKRLKETEAESNYLLLLGIEHNKLQQPEEALECLEKSLQHSEQANDSTTLGKALGHLGLTHLALGRPHRAIEYLEKQLKLLRKSGETEGEESILENLGNIYFKVGECNQAIEYCREELILARDQKDDRRLGRIFANLGEYYSFLGDFENAIEYLEEGLTRVKKLQDKKGEMVLLEKMGNAYLKIDKLKNALGYYQQGFELARNLKDQKKGAFMLGQMGHAHLISDNPREATTNYQKALTLYRKMGDKAKEGETLWNLAQAAEKAEKIPEAIQFAEAALVLYQRIKRLDKDTRTTIENQLILWKEGAGIEKSKENTAS